MTIVVANKYIVRVQPTAEHRVFHGILRVAEAFSRGLAETLKPFNLTVSQYRVLQALRDTHPGGLGCRELGERLHGREPDITRLLDRLEAHGAIARRRERPDRRVVRAEITEQGRALMHAIDGVTGALHARHLGHLGRRKLSAFSALLKATEVTF